MANFRSSLVVSEWWKRGLSHKPGEIVSSVCSLTLQNGQTVMGEIGTFYVSENRCKAGARAIGIGFLRLKAQKKTDAPPTFHLPGGPGATLLGWVNVQSPGQLVPEGVLRDITRFTAAGDMVFMDQRGYSQFGDMLTFDYQKEEEEPLDRPGCLSQISALSLGASMRALEYYQQISPIDLSGYSIKELAADAKELCEALGYRQVTLIGHSFGSQWAFATIRLFPEMVARAVLSGVLPLNCGLEMPSHIYFALQRMWWQVEQDCRFWPFLPEKGIAGAVQEIIRRLEEKGPVSVPLTSDGKADETIVLGKDDFLRNIWPPSMILEIYHGCYQGWAKEIRDLRRPSEGTLDLISPLINSSLGAPAMRQVMLRTDLALDVLGQWYYDGPMAKDDIWPTKDVGDDFRNPVKTTIPTVFVQGTFDTSTPMENLLSLTHFVNGRTILIENGGHDSLSAFDCIPEVMDAIMEFVKTGNGEKLPSSWKVAPPQSDLPEIDTCQKTKAEPGGSGRAALRSLTGIRRLRD
jgi:pimeloyl-ACP methyl ester carboxylesterase